MDLESQITSNLGSKGYDDFTTIRWIYLYVCRMFSYDTRFPYAKQDLKEKIYNKKIDLKNAEDFEVVCYTIARVLVDILTLYGFESQIIRESKGQFTHAYVIVKHKNYVIKLDPTARHDITRVKMNSTTLDFTSLTDEDYFLDELLEADKEITSNYKDIDFSEFYNNKSIIKLVNVIEESAKKRNLSDCELFFEKIEYLFSLINRRTDFKRYDDIDYYFAYLIKKFKVNEKTSIINGKKAIQKINYVKPSVFFNINDKSMKDVINITFIDYENMPPVFYLLRKEGETFKAREIFKDEAMELLSKYESPAYQCQYIFQEAAKKLATGKEKGIII